MIQSIEGAVNGHQHRQHQNHANAIVSTELTEAELANVGGGRGAGKVSFNPFPITKHVDKASPVLFL